MCQIAIRKTRKGTELWNWDDEYGPERISVLPSTTMWRDVVEYIAGNEQFAVEIIWDSLEILPDGGFIGQIYALAWSAHEDDQRAALLLTRLDEQSLERLADGGRAILAPGLRVVLKEISRKMFDLDVEIKDLDQLAIRGISAADVRRAFRSAIARSVSRKRAIERNHARRLRPFVRQIEEMIARWRADKPNSRYPGGGAIPPHGLHHLSAYLRSYVLDNGLLPTGVHRVPGGTDGVGRIIKAFDVNFDDLALDAHPIHQGRLSAADDG